MAELLIITLDLVNTLSDSILIQCAFAGTWMDVWWHVVPLCKQCFISFQILASQTQECFCLWIFYLFFVDVIVFNFLKPKHAVITSKIVVYMIKWVGPTASPPQDIFLLLWKTTYRWKFPSSGFFHQKSKLLECELSLSLSFFSTKHNPHRGRHSLSGCSVWFISITGRTVTLL